MRVHRTTGRIAIEATPDGRLLVGEHEFINGLNEHATLNPISGEAAGLVLGWHHAGGDVSTLDCPLGQVCVHPAAAH
jgi:hypothetical protein